MVRPLSFWSTETRRLQTKLIKNTARKILWCEWLNSLCSPFIPEFSSLNHTDMNLTYCLQYPSYMFCVDTMTVFVPSSWSILPGFLRLWILLFLTFTCAFHKQGVASLKGNRVFYFGVTSQSAFLYVKWEELGF